MKGDYTLTYLSKEDIKNIKVMHHPVEEGKYSIQLTPTSIIVVDMEAMHDLVLHLLRRWADDCGEWIMITDIALHLRVDDIKAAEIIPRATEIGDRYWVIRLPTSASIYIDDADLRTLSGKDIELL